MTFTPKVLAADEGLRLQSGPDEELGPLTRNGNPDHETVAAIFERYGMTQLGPPLS